MSNGGLRMGRGSGADEPNATGSGMSSGMGEFTRVVHMEDKGTVSAPRVLSPEEVAETVARHADQPLPDASDVGPGVPGYVGAKPGLGL